MCMLYSTPDRSYGYGFGESAVISGQGWAMIAKFVLYAYNRGV